MAVILWTGNTSPSLADTIKVAGQPFDLTGSTVKLQTRLDTSGAGSALKVDADAAVVSPAAGDVRYDWVPADVDTAGNYLAWWRITLPNGKTQDSDEFLIVFHDHGLQAGNLCSLADVKASFEPAVSTTSRDPMIQMLIGQASREMMKYCERQFAPATTAVTNRFTVDLSQNPAGGWIADLAPLDVRTVTSAVLHPEEASPTTVTPADYALEPVGNQDGVYYKLRLSPYLSMISAFSMRFGQAQVDVTGDWGFATVPADVSRLCVLTVKAWMRQNPAAYAFPDVQPMEQVQPESPTTFMLPGAVLAGLSHYKRVSV